MIARAATSQDDITGDGTTSAVLMIAELLKQSAAHLAEGLHPRIMSDGLELAKMKTLQLLEDFAIEKDTLDEELLLNVARTSLKTKVKEEIAEQLAEYCVEGVLTIRRENRPIDLFMIEIMHMQHKHSLDTSLIRGLVLDHGARHPDMPKEVKNAFILTCNVSLEYEKRYSPLPFPPFSPSLFSHFFLLSLPPPSLPLPLSFSEVNSEFKWKSAEERNALVDAEREFTDDRVRKILEFKREVCSGDKADYAFVVINQKGIDPPSLDMLAKEGIIGIRRAKRRNMERLTLACGGLAVNSVEDLTPDVLGFAESVREQTLGEQKYTFVEGVENPFSCTILIKGPTPHSIAQVKDALRDGIRAVKNAIEDEKVVPGAGAFEIFANRELYKFKDEVKGRTKLGVQAFADALLVIPKTLAENSGFDTLASVLAVQEAQMEGSNSLGLDLETGEAVDAEAEGIWDNYRVKRQLLHSSSVIASQILLVDEIVRAGRGVGQQRQGM
eukprot:TRINITY_DN205_c0_g1_i2.p1 TRINITY_DN205_c0_g1~~TRINITY_DN205_c0_g1_i2.p1  ORF type:complete len:498 (-),score=164.84 TRINITY_DN205_c0_g1_i2:16-1509(-)